MAALTLVAILLTCCMAWLATGFVRSRIDQRAFAAGNEAVSLRRAEQAIAFFAGLRGRLPCPADDVDGAENCAADTGAWLPAASLGSSRHATGGDAIPVRYRLYTGSGAKADAVPAEPPVSDGLALCARLHDAATPSATYALIATPAGRDPEDAAARKVVGAARLSASLGCASVLASQGSLARGLDWAGNALDLRSGNVEKADHLANVMRMLLLHRTLELDLAIVDLGAGVHTLIDNQMKLQAAIAATLAGLPPPANAIPDYVAGIGSATRALTLNAIDIPRASVSLALDSATLGRYRAAAGEALDVSPWRGEDGVLALARRFGIGTEPAGASARENPAVFQPH